jgi:hypothetical protein
MKPFITAIILTAAIALSGIAFGAPDISPEGKIQIALLLDTSSSMDGLI